MKTAYFCMFLALAGCGGAYDEGADEDFDVVEGDVSTVVEGDYVLKIASTGKCVDVDSASVADGAKVQQWTCNGTEAQVFHFAPIGDGYYVITNRKSNKALDVRDVSKDNGAPIQQWGYGGGANQQWQVLALDDGSIGLRARHSGRVLDVREKSAADGAQIQQWDWWATTNQRFFVEKKGGGGGAPAGWKMIWSDEFNGANGSAVDGSKWAAETGGNGWGNSELQHYTAETKNAHMENGSLVITATPDGAWNYGCWYGACQYTSARLVTRGKIEAKFGRMEARIQIPRGQGIWPAFWMLGNNIGSAGWPNCGEIDIMENIGKEPGTVHGSLHGPGYSGGNPLTATYSLPGGAAFADAYHTFAVEWEPSVIRFYVDDNLYQTRTPNDVAGKTWVYDHPFFLLLNVAVGGNWPGSPDGSSAFPQSMRVDYVRVYAKQ